MAFSITTGGKTTKYNSQGEYNKALKAYKDKGYTTQGSGNQITVYAPQKKSKLVPRSAAVKNQRRNNYNQTAQYYGFNSRNEVRKVQQKLKDLGYKIGDFGVGGLDGYMGG